MAKDPVCGRLVNRNNALEVALGAEYQDRLYFFCSAKCKLQFHAAPYRHVATRLPAPERMAWFDPKLYHELRERGHKRQTQRTAK